MVNDSLTATHSPAPWRVLLPCTLVVALLHWWLLDGLAQESADRAPTGLGDVLPAAARSALVTAGETAGLRIMAVTTRPATEVTGNSSLRDAPPAGQQTAGASTSKVESPVAVAAGTARSVTAPPQPQSVSARPSALKSTSTGLPPARQDVADVQTRQGLPADSPESRRLVGNVPAPSEALRHVAVAGSAGPAHDSNPDDAAALDHSRLALAAPRPSGRAGGSAVPQPGAVPAALPPPPTLPPPNAELVYGVRRGPLSGEGRLVWRVAGGSYTLSLEARLPVIGAIFSETSAGGFDAYGLAPQRYTERRLRRSERALTMTRDGPGAGTLSFSASTTRLALLPGTQDRLSWLVQLAALFAAAPLGGPSAGSASAGVMSNGATLPVASVNGDLSQWQFKSGAPEGGLLHLERRPPNPYDTVAEVWLDPARRYWPVRIRLSEAGGDALEMVLSQWHE